MKRAFAMDLKLLRTTAGGYALKNLRIARVQGFLQVSRVSRMIGSELGKIHERQNHTKLARDTFLSNAVGLLMGMLSAQFVSRFFEVRSVHNLWGIFSKQTIVSDSTYGVLCFGVEFCVALIAFTLTDHFVHEFRSRRAARECAESESIAQP